MRNLRCRLSFVFLLLLAAVGSSFGQVAKIRISGTGLEAIEVTAADLAKMPRLALDVKEPHSGETQHYEGVRLSDLLLKAGAPLGQKLRGQAMATYVVARASDGYAVVYSLAELDPALNDNQIMLADTINGKALDAKQGPFKVVVPGDKRPARWIKMVTAFEVENAINPSGSSPR
jgi:hypothetical protein